MGELLDQVTDRLLCPHCGRVGALIGDRRASCQCGRSWYIGPDEQCDQSILSPLRFEQKGLIATVDPDDDAPLPALSGIARLEERIEAIEALVKRIAAHLGIEG